MHSSAHPERPVAAEPWHARDVAATLAAIDSDSDGLDEAEAEARLARHGPNRLPPPPRRGALRRLAEQFNNVLIYVLVAAAVVSALLGHWVDTGVIVETEKWLFRTLRPRRRPA